VKQDHWKMGIVMTEVLKQFLNSDQKCNEQMSQAEKVHNCDIIIFYQLQRTRKAILLERRWRG
jgi:hypothetical protein